MTIADLVLVLVVLAAVVTLLRIGYALVRGMWSTAGRTSLALGACLAIYAAILIGTSLVAPQRVLGLHQDRCFDDWCIAVDRVTHPRYVGTVASAGRYYVVTVQVSSQARGASQRALDARIYLTDAQGRRYEPVPTAQQGLTSTAAGNLPLDSELAPGGSFMHTAVFDLPLHARNVGLVVTHGLFPDILVIGDPQSFLHKPTIIRL